MSVQSGERHIIHYLMIVVALIMPLIWLPLLNAQQSTEGLPSVASINSQIEQIKNDAKLDENQKSQKIGQLQLILKQRDEVLEQRMLAKNYAESITQAVIQQSAIDDKIARLKDATLSRSEKRASLEKLEALVTKSDGDLAALRKQLSQLVNEIKNEKGFDIQVALDEARQAIQLRSVEPVSSQVGDIERQLQQVSLILRQAQIETLEQRLLSRNPRLALWDSEQKWLTKQISILESRLAQLRALVTNHRQSEVNQLKIKAETGLTSVETQPRIIQELAIKNIQLVDELSQLINEQDMVIEQKEKATLEAQRIQQKFTSLTEQLAITQLGSSPEFGAALRKQRDQIADESKSRRALNLQKQSLSQGRLAQFRIDAMLESDLSAAIVNLESQFNLESASEITEEQRLKLTSLLSTRQSILEKLSTAYWKYISNLTSLTLQSDSLIILSKQYADLLDQQLLWMPSSPIFELRTFAALDDSIQWLFSSSLWQGQGDALWLKLQTSSLLGGIALLLVLMLTLRRSQMINALSEMKGRVGKVNRDSFGLTLMAFLITTVLTLPIPLLMILAAFLFDKSNAFSNALAETLHYGAMIYFVLGFAYQSARKNGLLALHLKWSKTTVIALHDNLPWFILVMIPAVMVKALIEETAPVEVRDSLGRLILIVEAVAMMLFAAKIFPPVHSERWQARAKHSPNMAAWLYRHLRFVVVVLLPVSLAGASIYGYHYSTVQIENHLLNSALVILVGNLCFCLSQRAFAINERQLMLEKLLAKRAAAAAAKNLTEEELEENEDLLPSANDLQEIDLQTISKQTHTLLKMVFTVIVGIALWRVWAEIFPAFKPLVNIELWQVMEMKDGIESVLSITLWDLLLTLVTLVITYLATKNIPGLLDIVLLSRVSLQPGSSYAIATVAQYAIVIIGTVIALQGLGAQWSKLQWLIAALSVGLGFGLQEMVANFVSGIMILFERPYRIGDTVTVGDQWGMVSKIRMRATTIIDWDRREIIVPNKTFITERLTNWTLTDAITRRKINVGVAYGSDIELVERLLLKIADENPKVQDEPAAEALFVGFGESCLDFCLRIFVKGHREHAGVAHEIHKAIDREFRAHGIEIAFPQRDLHLDAKPLTVQLVDSIHAEPMPQASMNASAPPLPENKS